VTIETRTQEAGGTRLPAYSAVVPSGSTFQLIAAWLLLAEGGLGLIFAPVIIYTTKINIPPGKIAGFVFASLLCFGAGGLLYSRRSWSWLIALAVAAGVAVWLLATGGLTSMSQAYAVLGFATVEVAFLALGRHASGRPEAMAISSANIPFRVKVGVVWLALFFVIVLLLALFNLDSTWIKDNAKFIAEGVEFTVLLALGAIILAIVLALLGALGRLSKNPVAYGISGFYTSFFRGTPLIVQLFLIYTALPQIGQNLDRLSLVNILTLTGFQAGVLGLGLNYGAYMTEIFRAGIQSVGHGQAEAADALGMTYAQRMRRVVLPQATRVIIPPTGNEFIAMMKDTALVSFLGVEVSRAELFLRARLAGEADFRKLEALLVAAGMYWGLTAIFTFFQRKLERRMGRGYERGGAAQRKPKPRLLSLGEPGPVMGGAHLPAAMELGSELEEDGPPQ
jgi:polar amino acid transport system permease protein